MLGSKDDGPFLTAEQLPQPWRGMVEALSAHDAHPVRGWFVGIGNGVFEDDHTARDLPAPHPIYQFRHGDRAAYIWQAEDGWFVRPWQRMRGRARGTVVRVTDLGAALDELVPGRRPWWRFWA